MPTKRIAAATAALLMAASPALADDAPAAPAPPVLSPAFSGPLGNNPNPLNFDLPVLGKVYVTGVVSGLLGTQSHSTPGVASSFADVSNAQVIIQKIDGVFQFYVQAGLYSQETLGVPYTKAATYTDSSYGPVPQAWIKIAPSANFNIQAGILPSMIGAEAPFTFQNMNIDRGILWGQENVMTRGVQANLTLGKLALSLSLTDGFFGGKLNWLSGLAAYTINASNSISFVAGGPFNTSYRSSFATSPIFNNSSIYDVIYTYSNGPIMIQPYFQYTSVPALPLFETGKTETYSGAVLAKYNFSEHFSLPVRFEYISTSAPSGNSPSVLLGPGSEAFSFTITPTYLWKQFFARPEFSVVAGSKVTPGYGFGADGNSTSQVRGRFEFGLVF